jgi:hypothetical protein
LRVSGCARLHSAVTIRFSLPGGKKPVVAVAAVCWSTEPIFGMQFISMDDECREAYDEWLSSMALL